MDNYDTSGDRFWFVCWLIALATTSLLLLWLDVRGAL